MAPKLKVDKSLWHDTQLLYKLKKEIGDIFEINFLNKLSEPG